MRIAIVGSGVSGLGALWLLNEYSEHQVNIYEKNDYPGGHTHTVDFERPGKKPTPVDTGFIVLNPVTYPNFLRFLRLLSIPLLPTQMTFSVSRDRGLFEWAGEGLQGVFCQWQNLFNPRVWRMLFDVLRFNLFALDLLDTEEAKGTRGISIGEYLDRENYGPGFREDYLLPMTAAIWSTPADQAALDFPAATLIRFFHNHHLLQITGKPDWLTVKGGAKRYVDRILSKLPPENLHLNTEITSVSSIDGGGVKLVEAGGREHIYDHVIMATHSDTTLEMLHRGGGVMPEEEKALRPWDWSTNEAVLHWDERFMPIRKRAYSAWNYLTSTTAQAETAARTTRERRRPGGLERAKRELTPRNITRKLSLAWDEMWAPHPRAAISTVPPVDTVSLTYSMNILQHLPESQHGLVLVTLNPPFPVDPSKTIGQWTYHHPMMTARSVSSQPLLSSIQNTRGISYGGAWTKYGFHEDGFTSAMRLVCEEPFGVVPPFEIWPGSRVVNPHLHVWGKGLVGVLERARRGAEPLWARVMVLLGLVGWVLGIIGGVVLE